MRTFLLVAAPLLSSLVRAQTTGTVLTGVVGNETVAGNAPGPDADGKYTISAPGIRAHYIPYGASLSNLFINDTHGIERDVVLGYDNASYYSVDTSHPHLNGIPGRYANRIKNSTFEIDGVTSHIIPNDHNGQDTLHGGPNGWDWRNWTVVAHTESSITFSLADPDGEQGFPGEVIAFATYSVENMTLNYRMVAVAPTKKTPIMLTSHTYWNLDGFQNPDTPLALNHTLSLPYSGQRVGVDGILIPDGSILPNEQGSVNDFWSAPKQLGSNFSSPELVGNCGTGCAGYDNGFIVSRQEPYDWRTAGPVAVLSSSYSGIQVSVYTDQEGYQVYSCNSMAGTMALKSTQGLFDNAARPRVVEQYGCIVMEVQDWIDGINQPEWGRVEKQVFGPDTDPYVLQATLKFALLGQEECVQPSANGESGGLGSLGS